jgi:potassium-dependent mechanosensitive channel
LEHINYFVHKILLMKSHLKVLLYGLVLLLSSLSLHAQTQADSTTTRDTSSSNRDTSRNRRSRALALLFADTAKLTTSDYQLQIEKTFVTLTNVANKSELGLPVSTVRNRLADSDSVLAVLKDNVLNNSNALNLRNLQVFHTLLQNLQTELKEHRATLDSTESSLVALRNSLKPLAGDTVLRQVWRDTVLRQQFSSQLKDMRQAFRAATGGLRGSLSEVNLLQTRTSASLVTTSQLLATVNHLLSTSATRIFGKEYNYLWETDTTKLSDTTRTSLAKAYNGERKAVRYYFKGSGSKRLFLLLIGLVFFAWTFNSIRTLRKHTALSVLDELNFVYLPSGYVVSALVVMFCLAPLFDLHAPSVYIEFMQFLLLIMLTIICWKKWPRNLFVVWIVMALLYICFSFTHHIVNPSLGQRFWLILLNVLSVVFGVRFLSKMKEHLHLKGFLRFVIILHNVMNVLSLLCNIGGRFTLAQLLGNAAIFAFMQAVGLAVFSKIAIEAIQLQIVSSRVKRGIQTRFEFQSVLASFRRLVLFLVVVLWLIVFTTNLNIYNTVLNGTTQALSTPRRIGEASFTLGGVLLFFMIIWIAHLLQKYIGYFFGATDGDEETYNKGQRSRLLIARLILLCLGYLLAVAASGVPVDKITIVLGALGVGIGLGLQNIVNNFVSGIILIFDRPLQIGDIVELGNSSGRIHTGRVREIGLRSCTLLTNDGAEVIIPNGDILSEKVVNWTLTNNQRRLEVELTINGSDDMEQVCSVIKRAVLSARYVAKEREPQVLFLKQQGDGFTLRVFFWCQEAARCEETKSEVLLLLTGHLQKNNLVLV